MNESSKSINETDRGLSNQDSPLFSLVLPIYNEGDHISTVIGKIETELKSSIHEAELVVIDDGSTDNTWEVLNTINSDFSIFHIIRLSRNFGKESALSAGIEHSNGRSVITMDGDLQHPPEIIIEMLRLWQEEGYEVVEAVKRKRGSERSLNKFCANMFYRILNWFSGFDLSNASDFKLLDRKVVNALCDLGERNLFFRGTSNWIGFSRRRIEFDVGERVGGQSKWSMLALMRLASTAITAFSVLPLQLITFLGVFLLSLSVVLGVQTFINWWIGNAIDGFTTVILLQLLIGSIVMISLGIIGVYIARIYTEVKRRPRFIISESLIR